MNFEQILWLIEALWASGEWSLGLIMWLLVTLVKLHLGWS